MSIASNAGLERVSPRHASTLRPQGRAGAASTCASVVTIALVAACGPQRSSSSSSGPRVVVSNELDGTIAVIDARSRERITTIAVGKRPRGLVAAPDGKTLYVALSGSPRAAPGVDEATLPPPDRGADGIGVVDLERLVLVGVIPSGQDPESFDLVGDDVLVVSNEETAEASIVDLRQRAIRTRVPVGGEPEGVATAPDGLVWVTSEQDNHVTAIDPVRGAAVATIAVGLRPRWIAFTRDGSLGLVTGENDASVTLIDPRARRSVGRIELPREGSTPIGPRPMGVAIAEDGKTAYVAMGRGGSVAVIDLATRAVTKVIGEVGARPWGIAVGTGGELYTANGPSNDVSVIDPVAGTVVRRIAAGGSPWGVVVVR